ncbi:MAG TPA: MBL fold metallo-hydrolase [Casimicrobiaceae bacterium]|nr:MBL fold metallo-hydrolase [Casimicrobiaceae bacterium]
MRFACLGSGSEGNGLLVECGSTRVLIDCGFGIRDAVARLARLGVDAESVTAIIVTHEHSDHVGGVAAFAARYGTAVWLTFGTLAAVAERFAALPRVYGFDSHDRFAIDGIEVRPFPVPHDAREPVQFVCSDGRWRIGVLTDLGVSTAHVEASLSGCDALVLECNHDVDMLANGDYPYPLKQRIAGKQGHLDNAAAAALLGRLDNSRLKHLVAAHLSQHNNRPDLARAALAGALNCAPDWIGIADQHEGFAWREFVS